MNNLHSSILEQVNNTRENSDKQEFQKHSHFWKNMDLHAYIYLNDFNAFSLLI